MIGDRLKQLRLARGLSLESLAASMGGIVTKQALSKYEMGKAEPSAHVLAKLASELGVKAASLWEPLNLSIQQIAYRKRSSMRVRERGRIESVARVAFEERISLQKISTGGKPLGLPIQGCAIKTLEDAEGAAEWLRKRWNLGVDPIADVTATLEDHAIHVIAIEADETFDGLSLCASESKQPLAAAVVCRKGLAGERQRLNLAHELGHLVLAVPKTVDEEKAAFRFGAAFIAPKETLLREVGSTRRYIDLQELLILKKRFGLSIQALLFRLHSLNVISQSIYREWCISINRQGWRKKEPEELPEELPQWLARTVYWAVAEGWLQREEGERMLDKKIALSKSESMLERRAFMRLPIEERRRILEKQAEKLAPFYETDTEWKELGGGDIVEY